MAFKKVTAIIRNSALPKVVDRLQEIGASGVTLTHVKGFGEYKNPDSVDWMSVHSRIEIFTSDAKAEECIAAILEAAHRGATGDGIVTVETVDKIYRIRERREARPDEI